MVRSAASLLGVTPSIVALGGKGPAVYALRSKTPTPPYRCAGLHVTGAGRSFGASGVVWSAGCGLPGAGEPHDTSACGTLSDARPPKSANLPGPWGG